MPPARKRPAKKRAPKKQQSQPKPSEAPSSREELIRAGADVTQLRKENQRNDHIAKERERSAARQLHNRRAAGL